MTIDDPHNFTVAELTLCDGTVIKLTSYFWLGHPKKGVRYSIFKDGVLVAFNCDPAHALGIAVQQLVDAMAGVGMPGEEDIEP